MSKARVLQEMEQHAIDVLLLGRDGNARYVSGESRLFLAGERAFTPGLVLVRETGALHNLYPPSWNPATTIGRVADLPGVAAARRIGVDGLTPLFDQLLAARLPGAELVDGEAVMRTVRRIKSPAEIDRIRAAAEVAKRMMAAALSAVKAGHSDGSITAIAMEVMANAGTTTAAFEPRVRRSQRDDRVTVAIGVLRNGWEADLSRTTPGPARPAALTTAIDRCRPGVPLVDVQANVHGVGLGYEVLSPDEVLDAGMVLSVGVNGARDVVAVTEDGPEILT